MKTEPIFHYSTFPLKIAESNPPQFRQPFRIIEKNDFRNQRFSFIENKSVQDSNNWDASWFASYE